MVEAHLTAPDERNSTPGDTKASEAAEQASEQESWTNAEAADEYADASHWMHSVSADSTDEAESGAKINLTDIDLTALGEDEAIPDKGTAHSFGRKVNIALCAIAFIVLFGYLFIAGEAEDTFRALTSFNYLFLFLALAGIVVYWLLEALSMQIICDSLYRGFSFGKTFIVTIIGQYFNCITPLSSGGQPMQAYYYQRFGLPIEHAMPMLLCRFIAYQFTMIVYAIIVLALRFNYFMADMRPIMYLVAIGFFGGFLLIAMLLALAFAKGPIMSTVAWAIKLLGRIGILKHPERSLINVTKSLEESYQGIRYLLKEPAVLIKVSLVTFVQLTVYFSLSWVIFAGFGLDLEKLGMDPIDGYFTVISCQAFIYLIASFVPLPGAIGASEASYITFFNYVYQNASIVALSTFIWRAFTFYLPIVLGMILTLLVNNENSRLAHWIRKDDTRMAFTDHTVVKKSRKKKKKDEGGNEATASSTVEEAAASTTKETAEEATE